MPKYRLMESCSENCPSETPDHPPRIEALDEPVVAYIRSWEINDAQPRMRDTRLSEFRHYLNPDKTAGRLHQLLADFQFAPACEVVLPFWDQVPNISAQAVPDSVADDRLTGSPQLTIV